MSILNSLETQKKSSQSVSEATHPQSEIEMNQIEQDKAVDKIHREEEAARMRRGGNDDENFSRDGAKELA